MNSFEQHLRAFPPFLCMALTVTRTAMKPVERNSRRTKKLLDLPVVERNGYRRMTREEVSELSGIPVRTVERIKSALTWDQIKTRDCLAFQSACGCAYGSVSAKVKLLQRNAGRSRPMPHLSAAQLAELNRMLGEYQRRMEA